MKRRYIYISPPIMINNKASNSTIGMDNAGQVWCWGSNTYGQLGNNSILSKLIPTSILGSKKTFCSIAAGQYHTIGIDKSGQVWGWGYNGDFELGDSTTVRRCTPVSILGTKKTFCQISAGDYHTIGIDNTGQIWVWGYNDNGQLGINSLIKKCTPVSILGTKKTFCKIYGGHRLTIGIDNIGQVWGWGYNYYGQLGDNTKISKCTPVSILGAKKTFCQIASYYHTIGIDKNGQVWGWGYNNKGQLGDNTAINKCTPVSILGAKKTFCSISIGSQHTIGLDKNGQVWGWGYNGYGQLGDNTIISKRTPVSILGTKKTFCAITDGFYNTIGIDNVGQVWGWGDNTHGELGINSSVLKFTPVSILGTNKTFCKISAGNVNTIGLDKNGQVWSWGQNNSGQLGDNTVISKITPVSILGNKKTFCLISEGLYSSFGLDNTGQVWSWGDNNYGQLGDNTVISKLTPVSILGAKKTFCQIIVSTFNHTLSIDNNNQLWTWGYNGSGQLGINSVIAAMTPVSILGAKKTFCKINASYAKSTCIDNNGLIWSWGYNNVGQLGNNSVLNTSTPVSILGNKKTFCQISGGQQFEVGIDKNGLIWCWGSNVRGQLGDNTIVCRSTPVSILGAKKTFCQISGGYRHTIGIDKNGQAWGWGYNNNGQLGVNSILSKLTPVSILGAKKTFCQISVGDNHTIGIDKNGQIWGWGDNTYSQLGNKINTNTPLRVCNF